MKGNSKLFLLPAVLCLIVFTVIFFLVPQEKHLPRAIEKQPSKFSEIDSEGPSTKASDRDVAKSAYSREDGIVLDRSSPNAALKTALRSLRISDYESFYESFSETGKLDLTDGVKLTEEELAAMGNQLKLSGFGELSIISVNFEEQESSVIGDAVIKSIRNERSINEKLRIQFSKSDDIWVIDSFDVSPMN